MNPYPAHSQRLLRSGETCAMSISLIETVFQGGCYWKHERDDSPGHSLAVPNGTPFKIAIEGPQSNRFIQGVCRDGYFVITEGSHSGVQFCSANEAVNTIREPSSNAFLHMHFQIDGRWVRADDFRRSSSSQLDDAEELALQIALDAVRRNQKGQELDSPQALRAAARWVTKRPHMIEEARRFLASMSGDLEDLLK
jgi:hypothetical protein